MSRRVSKNSSLSSDAGMTKDLIRPALYQAHHCIENITSENSGEVSI